MQVGKHIGIVAISAEGAALWRGTIVIVLTVPLAFTGVAIGLLVANGLNSFMALIGILSLIGLRIELNCPTRRSA